MNSLSEQQLIDCSTTVGNQGCTEGDPYLAFSYASHTSIEYEAEYPYIQKEGKCHNIGGVANVADFKQVARDDPVALANAVVEGPVSAGFDADSDIFKNYKSGIITSPKCGVELNHAGLIVGYGKYGSVHFWIVKNSFGPTWGEKGYFRIQRELAAKNDGECGINMDASYPIF